MESFGKNDILKLAGSFLIVIIFAAIGSLATFSQIPTWYATLIRPEWAPPNWVFPVVWTTLYILMALALFLVWKKGLETKPAKVAVAVFLVQLALNALWSVVFFGLHSIVGGLGLIVMLWVLILANIIVFYRISKWAGIFLIPYIIWVTIASYLNYTVYILNP
nr:TspO/MBR family protein [uncultured Methanobacterium sp.]